MKNAFSFLLALPLLWTHGVRWKCPRAADFTRRQGVLQNARIFHDFIKHRGSKVSQRRKQTRAASGAASPRPRGYFFAASVCRARCSSTQAVSSDLAAAAAARGPHHAALRTPGEAHGAFLWACERLHCAGNRTGGTRPARWREAPGACGGGEPQISPLTRQPGERDS